MLIQLFSMLVRPILEYNNIWGSQYTRDKRKGGKGTMENYPSSPTLT